MGTRHVVPQQPGAGGEAVVGVNKQQKKNVAARQGRNRNALVDIGNIVAVRGAEGKPLPQRPLTRSFCAQLMANGQVAASAGKNKNQVCVNVENGAAAVASKRASVPKPAQNKKAVVKQPKQVEVIEISPDVVSDCNNKQDKPEVVITISSNFLDCNTKQDELAMGNNKVVEGLSKRTLSSVLTARSKAAFGLANKPKDIIDIDAADSNNDLAEVEYVEDMYKYYKEAENDSRPLKYMNSQPEVNENMRAILVDWLIDVHKNFDLSPETLYLTINIVDRFLSVKTVPRRELQLVGMSAMLTASKYEEIWPLQVYDLVSISNISYTNEQVLVMEKTILGELEWTLTVPTHYVFLARFIKASIPDKELENMVYFLAELGLMDYDVTIMFSPSMVAASAVYAARHTLLKEPSWTETLELHTAYSEVQLRDCAMKLASLHSKATENKLQSVHRKYSEDDREAVAYRPAAEALLLAGGALL